MVKQMAGHAIVQQPSSGTAELEHQLWNNKTNHYMRLARCNMESQVNHSLGHYVYDEEWIRLHDDRWPRRTPLTAMSPVSFQQFVCALQGLVKLNMFVAMISPQGVWRCCHEHRLKYKMRNMFSASSKQQWGILASSYMAFFKERSQGDMNNSWWTR